MEEKTQSIKDSITVNCSVATAFAFHKDVNNLGKVLPPFLKFQITKLTWPVELGSEHEFIFKLFGLLPVLKWQGRFVGFNPPHSFTDREIGGIFKHFEHTHKFIEESGQTVIEDTIEVDNNPIYKIVFRLFLKLKLASTKAYLERQN